MIRLLAIAGAGALGALARYGLSGTTQRLFPAGFPGGTLVVNLLGCFLLGLLATLGLERLTLSPTTRTALLVGFLGSFTTFSTFGFESLTLLREGDPARAGLNILLSVGLGIAACWAGVVLAAKV